MTKDVLVLLKNDIALRVRKDGGMLVKKLLVSVVLYLLPILTVWVLLEFASTFRTVSTQVTPGENVEVVDH